MKCRVNRKSRGQGFMQIHIREYEIQRIQTQTQTHMHLYSVKFSFGLPSSMIYARRVPYKEMRGLIIPRG